MSGENINSVAEPLLDLQRLAAGIRWRRRTWISLALLGLFVGVLMTLLLPPKPTAVTRVLVVHADDQLADRNILMQTDVALCQTSDVAGAALKQINVSERPGDFLATYRCVGVTPNVLEITVSGTSDRDATRRVQAIANVVIANHVKRTQNAVDAQVKPLLDRRARLDLTLAAINKTISSTTSPAQLDSLYNVRGGLTSQILQVEQQAAEAAIGAPTVAEGTRVVDAPRALPIQLIKTGLTKAMLGLVLGLGAGLALAAVLCVIRDRPVLRRDIAAELGVSIIAQLPGSLRGPRSLWRRSSHVRERKRLAATLARVFRDAQTSMSLLEIGCPGTAAPLALDIAQQVVSERPVVIVASLDRGPLSAAAEDADNPVRIVDLADLPLDQPSPARRSELYLGVGSVGPGTSWVDLGRLGATTLLVVRTGHATTLGLHTIARQLAHSGVSAIGVVLVQPDPKDRSDGTLWEGLHRVLRRADAVTPMPQHRPLPLSNGSAPVLEPLSAPDEM